MPPLRLLQIPRLILSVLLALMLSACMVETETVLTAKADAEIDKRLLGAWRLPPEREENAMLFMREGKDGGVDVLMLEIRERGDEPPSIEWETATTWPTRLGTVDMLNVEMDKGKLIVAYAVAADGSISFGFMKTKPFVDAIEAGKLKGKVSKGWGGPGAKLQDTPERIKAFIRDNGGYDLFQFEKEKGGVKLERYTPK